MNLEEQESQLSAMFDGELSAAECELLSRRLGRDQELRRRWSRYALVGAALRADPEGRSNQAAFARRVQAAISAGETHPAAGVAAGRGMLWRLAAGGGIAAGVAGAAILWLRSDLLQRDAVLSARAAPPAAVSAPVAAQSLVAAEQIVGTRLSDSDEPASYVVPGATRGAAPVMPASLASLVVAHSEYSSPLVRRSLLSTLVNSDRAPPASDQPTRQ